MHTNEKKAKYSIPWSLLSVIAKLKGNAHLDFDASPNSYFSESELWPLASKPPPKVKVTVGEGQSQETFETRGL